jgi:hypothetical protein
MDCVRLGLCPSATEVTLFACFDFISSSRSPRRANCFRGARRYAVAAGLLLAAAGANAGTGLTLPEALKPDQMARLQFSATYTLSQQYRDGQQRTLFTDRAKGTPEQQAWLAALDAKDEELRQARNATRDRGAYCRTPAAFAVAPAGIAASDGIAASRSGSRGSSRSCPAKAMAIWPW